MLDAGFYMLMAAAVMSSLCLFLSLYSSDLDPNAQSYRASVIRQTSRIKNLFRHDPMEDMKRVRRLQMTDATYGKQQAERALENGYISGLAQICRP